MGVESGAAHALPVTLVTASLLALFYVYLSLVVVSFRRATKVSLGTSKDNIGRGEDPKVAPLLTASRTHANFAEYVPFAVILLGLLEMQGFRQEIIIGLAAALVLARLTHWIGMWMTAPNLFRALGVMLQWLVYIAQGGLGLYCVAAPYFKVG